MAIAPKPTLSTPNETPVKVQKPKPVTGSDRKIFTTAAIALGVAKVVDVIQDLQSAMNVSATPKSIQLGNASTGDRSGGGGGGLGSAGGSGSSEPGGGGGGGSAANGGAPQVALSVTENTPAAQFVDNQLWKISVVATNYSPPVRPVFIPGNYIHELVLEHSVVDPCYWKGSMIVTSNRFGLLESTNPDDNLNLEMIFRGDGKDELLIELSPLFPGSTELPPETWEIKSEFVVYDSEDIPWNGGATMAKRVYFWHKAYNLMIERGVPFSTAYHAGLQDITKGTNEDRMVPAGRAIKKLLEDAELQQYIDYNEWDEGAPTSKIFYNSSSGHSVQDSLLDLIPFYISSDGGPGFMYFHRGKNKFQMISLKKFFDNAGISTPGKYYYETFTIGTADTGTDDTNITPNKTPTIDVSKTEYSINLKKYNLIKDNSYTLTEPSASDSMQTAISHMMHTYNHKTKTFVVSYKNSEIKNVREYFKKNYTDKLLPGPRGFPLLPLNNAKKTQSRVDQRFESSIDKTLDTVNKLGRNYMLLGGLLLNLGVNFKVKGSTHRHAGRFIGLEKNKKSDNKYDYRLLGQWFVTNVITRWKGGELSSEITGNKVSTFDDLRFNEEV